MRKDSRKHQGSIYLSRIRWFDLNKKRRIKQHEIKKNDVEHNGVDRMFMCDPENDKLSDVLRRIGLTGVRLDVEPVSAVHVPSF